jgi:hypothetical protein
MSNLCFHESLVLAGCICEYINIAKSRSVLYLLVRQRIALSLLASCRRR